MENHSWRSREFCATCDLLAVEKDCNRDIRTMHLLIRNINPPGI